MAISIPISQETLKQWVSERLDIQTLEARLQQSGLDAESIKQCITDYRKCCLAKRQFTGFILLAVGAFAGFISCVLTLINPVPSLYGVILYGLTSVAILLIMGGLYYLFEG